MLYQLSYVRNRLGCYQSVAVVVSCGHGAAPAASPPAPGHARANPSGAQADREGLRCADVRARVVDRDLPALLEVGGDAARDVDGPADRVAAGERDAAVRAGSRDVDELRAGRDSEDRAGHVQDALRIERAAGRSGIALGTGLTAGAGGALEASRPAGPTVRTPGASFALVTAWAFSCGVPTLLRGSAVTA